MKNFLSKFLFTILILYGSLWIIGPIWFPHKDSSKVDRSNKITNSPCNKLKSSAQTNSVREEYWQKKCKEEQANNYIESCIKKRAKDTFYSVEGKQIVLRKPIVEIWQGCDLLNRLMIGNVYFYGGQSRFELAYEEGFLVLYVSGNWINEYNELEIQKFYLPKKKNTIWYSLGSSYEGYVMSLMTDTE